MTDRLAGWLHGAPRILAPGAHLEVPLLNVFCAPGNRLRNPLVASGERDLPDSDLQTVHGLVVTTPVRTTCDLGRLLHVDQALAAIDSMLRTGKVTKPALEEAMLRFKGYRGVVQLRRLVPLGDARSQSPGESILRLRWIDCELPPPVLQFEVAGPDGPYFLDLADPDSRFGAEYDGEEFHGPEQLAYDLGRRQWMSDYEAWHLLVARKEHMVGPAQPIYDMLNGGYYTAVSRPRRQFLPGRWSPPR